MAGKSRHGTAMTATAIRHANALRVGDMVSTSIEGFNPYVRAAGTRPSNRGPGGCYLIAEIGMTTDANFG
jgi:hypothetical protein